MFNQVTAFLTQNNLLDSNQSGFRSGHSTETAWLSVVENLRIAKAASKSSLLILLDLSATFDTVNHQILLSTLLRKGISGTALQWFESYLSDRSFKVSWRGEVSKSQHLAAGVHRASVLGPIFFSIYMASLGSFTHNVSGYVSNHGSPNGERDTASPRGRYGERPQRDSCLKIHM